MTERERAPLARLSVYAGHRPDVLVRDPDSPVGERELTGSVSRLVGRHDLALTIDLVDCPVRLVGRPGESASDRQGDVRIRHTRRCDDRVRVRVDSADADTVRRDPHLTVAAPD